MQIIIIVFGRMIQREHRTITAITAFLSNLIFPSISGLTHVILRGLLTRVAAGAVADLVWPWGRVNNCSLRHVCQSEIAVLCMRRRRKWHGVPSESVELSNPQGRVYKVFASNRSDDSRQGQAYLAASCPCMCSRMSEVPGDCSKINKYPCCLDDDQQHFRHLTRPCLL